MGICFLHIQLDVEVARVNDKFIRVFLLYPRKDIDVHERMVKNLLYRMKSYGESEYFLQWLKYESRLENVYISEDVFYITI